MCGVWGVGCERGVGNVWGVGCVGCEGCVGCVGCVKMSVWGGGALPKSESLAWLAAFRV